MQGVSVKQAEMNNGASEKIRLICICIISVPCTIHYLTRRVSKTKRTRTSHFSMVLEER